MDDDDDDDDGINLDVENASLQPVFIEITWERLSNIKYCWN